MSYPSTHGSVRRERRRLPILTGILLSVFLLANTIAWAAPDDYVTVEIIGAQGESVLTGSLTETQMEIELGDYVVPDTTDISDTTPSALHALFALLTDGGYDAADTTVVNVVDSSYGLYLQSLMGSEDPFYWTFQVDGEDSWVGVFDHKITAGETLSFVMTEYAPEPVDEFVTVEIIDERGESILTGTLSTDQMDVNLQAYVATDTTDISDTTPSALHALLALLVDDGYDPADDSVIRVVDSSYGLYLQSLMNTEGPLYWTFQVDGVDSMSGVFDHKITAGETLSFILTEYVEEPTPEPAFMFDPSGLDPVDVDAPAVLAVISESFAGTPRDWEIMDMVRYGKGDQVDAEAWLTALYDRLTVPDQTVTDLELAVIVLTATGRDARDVVIDGQPTDLVARIASAESMDIYGLMFGLAAMDSAAYPDADGAVNTRDSMIRGLLDLRLPDGGWSWSDTEARSDADTTAMAIAVLSGHMEDPDVKEGVDAALELLSSWQAADGTMGSSNSTSMVIVALSALGRDAQTDPLFVKEDGDLLSGLFRYATEEGTFGFMDNAYNAYATEQAFRALVTWQALDGTDAPQSAYVFATSPGGLTQGTELPYTGDAGIDPAILWGGGIALTVLVAGVAVWLRSRHRKED